MTANSTPESSDAVVAEMREVCPHEERFGDTIHEWADRLQSAHARELAEQQATIEALRAELAACDRNLADAMNVIAAGDTRADAAMGLLNTAVDVIEEGLSDRQSYDFRARAESCARSIKQALAGGERKDG